MSRKKDLIVVDALHLAAPARGDDGAKHPGQAATWNHGLGRIAVVEKLGLGLQLACDGLACAALRFFVLLGEAKLGLGQRPPDKNRRERFELDLEVTCAPLVSVVPGEVVYEIRLLCKRHKVVGRARQPVGEIVAVARLVASAAMPSVCHSLYS